MEEYRTIRRTAVGEYEEKKSRFIAAAAPVSTEAEALAFLDGVRRANRTARHNVYAYLLRRDSRTRYSDDGEPQKTAGMPTLEAIQHAALEKKLVSLAKAVRQGTSRVTEVLPLLAPNLGQLKKGYIADIVVTEYPQLKNVERVYIGGKLVAKDGKVMR